MLTTKLVRVRRKGKNLVPLYIRDKHVRSAQDLAQTILDVFEGCVGKTLAELDEELRTLVDAERDRIRVAGFIKLVKDTCEIESSCELAPETLRETLFLRAAQRRRNLGLRDIFERDRVLAEVASELGMDPAVAESSLFADLPAAQVVQRYRPISPLALVQRYNLALAQGILLHATRVEIHLKPSPATKYRAIYRAIKFRRLMHEVRGNPASGYTLILDGPMSLFEATRRYGLQLALFLPTLVACDGWSLRADVSWGSSNDKMLFELSEDDSLVSTVKDAPAELEELEHLDRSFAKVGGPWKLRREATIFNLKGKGLFVPDMVFEHELTKERVYLEAFGYWSRASVFQRVELLEQGFSNRVILAVSRRLRVSDEVASDEFPGKILVYTQNIPASAVRRILDETSDSDTKSPVKHADSPGAS